MDYTVQYSKDMFGEVVPLAAISRAMAKPVATGWGKYPPHAETFKNVLPEFNALVFDAAVRGELKVCNRVGQSSSVDELLIDIATVPGEDETTGKLYRLCTKLKHLTDWGATKGDVFFVEDSGAVMVELHSKDGDGIVRLDRGYVGWPESGPLASQSAASDTLGLQEFTASPHPHCVPLELLKLGPNQKVLICESIGLSSGQRIVPASEYANEIQERIDRQTDGFFTVSEAAQILKHVHPDIDIRQMIDRMRDATVAERGKEHAMVRDHRDRLPLKPSVAFREWRELVREDELIKWLDALGPGYSFPLSSLAPRTESPVPIEELDYSLLATPEQLVDAFGKWGMQVAWFDDLNSRKWLLNARRVKGQGQKGQTFPPMYCPFAVMNGLIEKVRKKNRLSPDAAWRTLEHKFPKVHVAFEQHDPRDRTGD